MSSDTDEDELLQMALKEQAQRDINYQKPLSKSSKPVVNLVQAPLSAFEVNDKHQHRNPNHRMSSASSSNLKRGGGGGDDDDDSNVEMLSISSGDEDSSREIPIQQQKNRERRPSRDDGDHQVDDGGEPRTWKRVDEAEVTAGNLLLDSEANTKAGLSKSEDKAGDMKYSSHSLEEVAEMVHGTVSSYEVKVHSTFRDFEESNILCPYMSDAVKEIAKACRALEGKESAPPVAVKSMHALHFEITKIHILRLCTWMRTTTEEMSKEEVWIPLSTLERNKSPYAISYLPLAFRAMIMSAMNQIDVMTQNLRSEATRLVDMLDQLQEIQVSVRIAFLNCFVDFAGYLEQIGGELSESRSNKESDLQNGYMNGFESELPGVHSGGAVGDSHKKLLIVLSNIGYFKDELCHGLYNKYKHIWLREKDEQYADIRDLVTSFSVLEEKVLENYTYAKSNLIREAASNYLLDSGVQWGGAPAVKGIRDATLELLHCLVAVHAEVFSAAKPLLERTLGILVEGLIDTFLSLFHEHKTKDLKLLDANGFCQLMLELEYFETVLHAYFSPEAHEAFKSLQGLLLEKACESSSEPNENPGHHRRSTRGSEDAMADDKQQGLTVSPDDLLESLLYLFTQLI